MVVLALGIMPDFEYYRTQPTTAPSNSTKLLRIVILLVDQVSLVKNLLRLFETYTVFTPDIRVFWLFKVEPRI
jgi:hypothetical protein